MIDLTQCLAALEGEGPFANEWKNKPHRLIHELINEVVEIKTIAANLVEALEASNVQLQSTLDCGYDSRDENKADDYGVTMAVIEANKAAIKLAEGK